MAFLNPKTGQLQIKIVYAGPGRGGKTTNLEYLYKKVNHKINTEMVTINTYGERTLFFDFFPIDIGRILGHELKIQLYSAPGQLKYNTINRLVLRGVDGIVFVADSMAVRRESNIYSLKKLQDNMAAYERDLSEIPLVFQYNKRDLEKIGIPLIPIEDMEQDLNSAFGANAFEASALLGINVLPTLKKIIALTATFVQNQLLQQVSPSLGNISPRTRDERPLH